MRIQSGYLSGVEGNELFYQSWLPDGEIRADIAVVHGIGEHGGRYGNYIDALIPRGFGVHALDHRGHGRSSGRRGSIDSWAQFREDLQWFLNMIFDENRERPLFLLGHSMGGLMVLDFVLQRPNGIRGVVVSAPPLGQLNMSPVLLGFCRFLNLICPGISLASPLDCWGLSRDLAVISDYLKDPLVHNRGTPRLAIELWRTAQVVLEQAHRMSLPLLVIHGSSDRLTRPAESRRFVERVRIDDKCFLEYPGAYHELHNDLNRERVIEDVLTWLEERA